MKNKLILFLVIFIVIFGTLTFYVIKSQRNISYIEENEYSSDLNNCMKLPVSEDAREGFNCIQGISAIVGKLEYCEKIKEYALNDYTEQNYNICINEVNKANYLKNNSVKKDILLSNNPNYTIALDKLELCNSEYAGGFSDSCAGYHYFNRGCYYENRGDNCIGGFGLISEFGLTVEEANDVCRRNLHPGLTAVCLKTVDVNNGLNNCIDFSKGDEYLIAICNLKLGEELPFEPRKISDFN